MFQNFNTKRISEDDYSRPKKTITDILQTQEDVEEKLEGYEEVGEEDINFLTIGIHLRYITYDKKNNKELFRFGGILKKIDKQYIVLLGKNNLTFSVQRYTHNSNDEIIHVTRFFRKNKPNSSSFIQEELNKTILKSTELIEKQNELIDKQKNDIEKLKKKN